MLPGLAAAGYRAAAADLRGHGASDATPRGYDLPGLADDVDALVRSLGAERAVVVGHDLGGWVGWTLAARHPGRLHGLVAVAAPPPRPGLVRGRALRALLAAQVPSLPEHVLLHRGGLRAHLDGARATPAPRSDVEYYVASVRVPSVAHTSLEPWRWLGRASLRPDGVRWWRSVRAAPAGVPVLRVDGGLDRFAVSTRDRADGGSGADGGDGGSGADGGDGGVVGAVRTDASGPGVARVVVPGVGHLLPEEAPEPLLAALLDWLPGVVRP